MGFHSLVLVNPGDYKCDEARWIAHGSYDVIENARVINRFEQVVCEMDFLIGTTAKERSVKFNYYNPEEIMSHVENKGSTIQNVGIVFGKEESGLPNEVLKQCDLLSTIPMTAKYPSLNLSQAVMVYAYALSRKPKETARKSGNRRELIILKNKIEDLLPRIGIAEESNIYNRIRERLMTINEEDIHLMLSFSNKIEKLLGK